MTAPTRLRTSTHPWTAAQADELRQLSRSNLSVVEIAARLARTPEQVFQRLHGRSEYAGTGVAMGNAQPAVKEAADYITGTNDEDGLVEVIDKFIMKPEA